MKIAAIYIKEHEYMFDEQPLFNKPQTVNFGTKYFYSFTEDKGDIIVTRTENEKYASVTVSCLGASKTFEYPSDGSYSFEIRKEVEKTEIIVEFNIVLKPYGWSAKSAKITISNLKLYVTVYFGNPNSTTAHGISCESGF